MAFEYASIGVCCGVLCAYHTAVLCSRHSNLSAMIAADGVWAKKHSMLSGAAEVTLAVQTLRNSVLVAIFIGTVAFNTMVLQLQAISELRQWSPAWVSQLITAALLACAFLSFAVCIRCASHSGYLFGGASFLESEQGHELFPANQPAPATGNGATSCTPASSVTSDARLPISRLFQAPSDGSMASSASVHVQRLVRMQAFHFSLAFRCLYTAFPFLFATAGSGVFIATTCCIAVFQAYVDFAHLRDGSFFCCCRR